MYVRRQRGEKGFTALLIAILLLWGVYLSVFIGIILIALHFILKYW